MSLFEFRRYIEENLAKKTAKTYHFSLISFEKWLKERGRTLDSFTKADVESYKTLVTRGSASSANVFLAAIKGYLRWKSGNIPTSSPQWMPEFQNYQQINLIRSVRMEDDEAGYEKTALTVKEIKHFLNAIWEDGISDEAYAGVVLYLYFGARSVELAEHLAHAQINFPERWMVVKTAKRKRHKRYLPWHEKIDPYMEIWCRKLPKPYPDQWMTTKLKGRKAGGMGVTQGIFRHTFETRMRLQGVDQVLIDLLMGHRTTKSTGESYTDVTQFRGALNDVMRNQHYMILNRIV